jgi:hypothetical protein
MPDELYGDDLAGVEDLTPDLAFVAGERCLLEALATRLCTPRNGLLDAPGYGFDLRILLNDIFSAEQVQQQIVNELVQDERVEDASVAVRFDPQTQQGTVTCRVVGAAGPFTFTLSVTELTVELLREAA